MHVIPLPALSGATDGEGGGMIHKQKPPAKAGTKARGDTTTQLPKHTETTHGAKCSCGCVLPVDAWFVDGWLPELHMLAARFASTGITPDLAALCLCEAYGLFLWLSRRGG
jgi:hypothetical protein